MQPEAVQIIEALLKAGQHGQPRTQTQVRAVTNPTVTEVRPERLEDTASSLMVVPQSVSRELAVRTLPESTIVPSNAGVIFDQLSAFVQGEEIDTRDMFAIMSIGAVMIMSMVMLFQSMTTTMLLKRML